MTGGERDLNSLDGINQAFNEFQRLLGQAVNSPNGQTANPITYELEIEIAQVLFVGGETSGTPDVAIIEDTDGEIWMIPEGKGVKSRRDVCVGLKLKLSIEDNTGLRQGRLIRFRNIVEITILNKEQIKTVADKCSME